MMDNEDLDVSKAINISITYHNQNITRNQNINPNQIKEHNEVIKHNNVQPMPASMITTVSSKESIASESDNNIQMNVTLGVTSTAANVVIKQGTIATTNTQQLGNQELNKTGHLQRGKTVIMPSITESTKSKLAPVNNITTTVTNSIQKQMQLKDIKKDRALTEKLK